ISIGGVEMGQGCLTVLAQIAAETLMIPVHKIRINHEINSQTTPYEWQTVASMTTMRVGNAIIEASEKAISIFKENAALAAGCSANECTYNGESVSCGSKTFGLRQLVKGFQHEDGHTVGRPVMATGSSVVRNVTLPDPDTGQYKPYEWTFGAQGCDIKISKRTGKIDVLHFVTVLDVGKVINPDTARGQILGGVMQGMGQALQEEIIFDDSGNISNTTLRKYKVPKFSDMPGKYSCYFLENPQPNGPFGARPLAEHPVIGPPPAILNALQHATGLSLNSLPATPDKVLGLLNRRDA
ncbi:MAG: xanthine dehydrogenase family protein molybdopterin-binding subunit, partial [Candidatus Hodarchaeales archaeon]